MKNQSVYTAGEVDMMLFKLEVALMNDEIKTREELIKHIFDTITDLRIALKQPLFSE